MSTLKDFLLKLGTDHNEFVKFKANKTKSMSDAGISEKEQSVILKGDPAEIKRTLGGGEGHDIVVIVL